MNESYFQSTIEDRKREVSEIVEENRIYKRMEDSATIQQESNKHNKNALVLWLMMIARWIKSVYSVAEEGNFKAQR